jgi:transposase
MEVIHDCCAGLDVHAASVAVCVIQKGRKQARTFGTMTADLLDMMDWLESVNCTHVAIESTGVYWKPVFNILEGTIEVMLVNARHVKAVKGRKTDVRDCEWLADLLRHGLLKPSFIPPAPIRALRELTRYRESLVREQTALSNRIQKLAESGNVKIGQVASRAMGVSGRAILTELSKGEGDVEKLADLARGRLREKIVDLRKAADGRLTETQRWVLAELLGRYSEVEAALTRVQQRIDEQIRTEADPFVQEAAALLETIPGVAENVAQTVLSEIGTDMKAFPTARNLTSWAGMCPGNDESAGKRRSSRTNPANRYLRAALIEAAWAASHTKNTYLSAQYKRLIRRMGKKKALVAVGHSILVVIYHIIATRAPYHELGSDYFDRQKPEAVQRRLIRRLEALGLRVTVQPAA